MHALHGLRSHCPGNVDYLLRILHLELEPSNNTSNRATQLRSRKVLADARPLAMQKGDLGKVGRCAPIVVDSGVAVLVGVDPAFRDEFISVIAPELWAAVDRVRAEDDASALGDVLAGDSGAADGFADCRGHGWVQTENLLADTVQQRHGFQIAPRDGGVARWDAFVDLGPEALLDVWVLTQEMAGPCEGTSGGFVLQFEVSVWTWT